MLLVGHGAMHSIARHHHCLPISIDDIRRGRVHTLDPDPLCDPTFVADAASDLARSMLPRRHYDSVVTMHVPYFAWLDRPAPGKRKRSGGSLLRQAFFRNLHGAMRHGGELLMELPATALSILDPGRRAGRREVSSQDLGRSVGKRSRYPALPSAERRCGAAARVIAAGATGPGGRARLFRVSAVGGDHCVLTKI